MTEELQFDTYARCECHKCGYLYMYKGECPKCVGNQKGLEAWGVENA